MEGTATQEPNQTTRSDRGPSQRIRTPEEVEKASLPEAGKYHRVGEGMLTQSDRGDSQPAIGRAERFCGHMARVGMMKGRAQAQLTVQRRRTGY